jgi:diguanylate cyclase (GGDEF)-like protein
LLALIGALAVIGFALRGVPAPALAILAPIAFATTVLGNAGTAAVLWATWRHTGERRSSFVLALVFATDALLTLFALGVFPTLPGMEPIVPAGPQAAAWIFVILQIARVGGALTYATVRRSFDGPALSPQFRMAAAAIVALVVCAALALALGATEAVPLITGLLSFGALTMGHAATFFIAALVIAAYAVFRLRTATSFDRAFAISLLALALDALVLAVGPRFNASYYASRTLMMISAIVVFVAAVQTLVSSRAKLSAIEARLMTIEAESAMTAGRIRALWKIASDQSISDDQRFLHIIQTATAAMRPGQPLFGSLSHLEGDSLVIDAAASTVGNGAAAGFTQLLHPGATFPFADTMMSNVYAAGGTGVWNDLRALQGTGAIVERLGCGRFIGTPVVIARRTYFLGFAAPEGIEEQAPFADDDIAFVEVVASFIASHFTQQMQYERIQFQIEHDALTGLENRVQFRRRVRDEISAGRDFAVAFVNLDGFRHVNEQEGHQIGDEVLVEVAAGLRSIDERNHVARTSGDEFGILLVGAGSVEAATDALERYANLFRRPFHTGDREGTHLLTVGASIGAARFPADGRTAEELMLRSDAALNVAKERGGSTVMLFDQAMEAALQAEQLRVAELTDAIAHGQLALVYQPTFNLATRAIVGAEALVRWDHPQRGRLPPGQFIGFAERNGLIEPLSRWVLERLVDDLTNTAVLPTGFRVYFNLSANLLENIGFISGFKELLNSAPDVVRHIGVEVTETAAMQNVERSMSTIDLLRGWGLSVAIDDFGTGYSSLSYLKQLTVDVIKIDQSFVAGLPDDERDAALSEMLIRITDRFGFATLAEGIETEAQATWLLEHGCRFGQGYLIARPASFDDLVARITMHDFAQ